MIRNIAILFGLMVLVGAYTWYDAHDRQAPHTQRAAESDTANTQLAPDFTFRTLDGDTHALSDFKDKIIVLNFWASWCTPCVIEFPQMLRLAESLKDESLFLFVSLDDDDAAIRRFLKQHGKNLPQQNVMIARDTGKKISQTLYQTYKLPETYLIAPDLRIAGKIIGADVDWDGEPMRNRLRALAR